MNTYIATIWYHENDRYNTTEILVKARNVGLAYEYAERILDESEYPVTREILSIIKRA